jgi:hypothetical protein
MFSRAMDDNSIPATLKAEMFKKAIGVYVQNAKAVCFGIGDEGILLVVECFSM